MSTQNLTVVSPCPQRVAPLFGADQSLASPRPGSTVAPKYSPPLSTNELDLLRAVVMDRIRTLYYRRWDLDDFVTDEVVAAVKKDPLTGSRVVALLDRLEDLMSEMLVVELMQSNLEKTPRFLAAIKLISKYKIWFPSCCVPSNRDLYLSLKERGYRWDRKAKAWKREG